MQACVARRRGHASCWPAFVRSAWLDSHEPLVENVPGCAADSENSFLAIENGLARGKVASELCRSREMISHEGGVYAVPRIVARLCAALERERQRRGSSIRLRRG